MSGATIPYQLRTNKAVERQLFVDLLRQLDRALHFETGFEYVSMGGPFLEDFRLLHEAFPSLPMTCVEQNIEVLKRQRFNKPHTKITYKHTAIEEFIDLYQPNSKLIAWLDYTSSAQLPQQLGAVQDLLAKLPSVSVVKITLNAHAAAAPMSGEKTLPSTERRLLNLREKFGHLPLDWLDISLMDARPFPRVVARLLQLSIAECIAGLPEFCFRPICLFEYADGQRMLTVSGLFGHTSEVERVVRSSRIAQWPFYSMGWIPKEISIPDLSTRERMFVRQLLPGLQGNGKDIRRKLRFDIAESPQDSERLLDQYLRFYRHMPYFERVAF